MCCDRGRGEDGASLATGEVSVDPLPTKQGPTSVARPPHPGRSAVTAGAALVPRVRLRSKPLIPRRAAPGLQSSSRRSLCARFADYPRNNSIRSPTIVHALTLRSSMVRICGVTQSISEEIEGQDSDDDTGDRKHEPRV